MRHRRQTTVTMVDGYRGHQWTQSVPPAAGAQLITSADKAPLPNLVVKRRPHGGGPQD